MQYLGAPARWLLLLLLLHVSLFLCEIGCGSALGSAEPPADDIHEWKNHRDPAVPPLDPLWMSPNYTPFYSEGERMRSVRAYYLEWALGQVPDNLSPGEYCSMVSWWSDEDVDGLNATALQYSESYDRIRDIRAYKDIVGTPTELYEQSEDGLISGLYASNVISPAGDSIRLSWYTPSCSSSTGSGLTSFGYHVDVSPLGGESAEALHVAVSAEVPCSTRYEYQVSGLMPDSAVRANVTLSTIVGTVSAASTTSSSIVITPRAAPSDISVTQLSRGTYEHTFAKPRMAIGARHEPQDNGTSVDQTTMAMSWAVPVDINDDGMLDIFACLRVPEAIRDGYGYKIFLNNGELKDDADAPYVNHTSTFIHTRMRPRHSILAYVSCAVFIRQSHITIR